MFDKNLLMVDHINKVCQCASLSLYRIGEIRQYLDENMTVKLVHAFISCYLDYCNSLFYNLSDTQLNRLQKIQNSAARLVSRSRLNEHITPILKRLHWLPVKARIEFKILVLTYKCLHDMAPVYLMDLIVEYKPIRTLRSQDNSLLIVPKIFTKSYGARSFQAASAELWNRTPSHIKQSGSLQQFMTSLKTHLFHCYFP